MAASPQKKPEDWKNKIKKPPKVRIFLNCTPWESIDFDYDYDEVFV